MRPFFSFFPIFLKTKDTILVMDRHEECEHKVKMGFSIIAKRKLKKDRQLQNVCGLAHENLLPGYKEEIANRSDAKLERNFA